MALGQDQPINGTNHLVEKMVQIGTWFPYLKKIRSSKKKRDFWWPSYHLIAVVICDRMVDAHDFACAAPEDMVLLVKKLKDIIQTNNRTTVECLQTVKLSFQLVVLMVQLKPISIKNFIEDNFVDVLSESSKILSDLDNCLMLFDVNYLQVTKTDKPLVSLVKQAQKLLLKNKETR